MNTPNKNAVTAAGNAPRKRGRPYKNPHHILPPSVTIFSKSNIQHVRYFVRPADQVSTRFSAEDYSKWGERFRRKVKGEQIEVYGREQAMEHIAELRHHVYEGRKIYRDTKFEIVRQTIIEETVASVPAA